MNLPKRKSPRIPEYDYGTPNYYFVTICTHEKKCIFGKPGELNGFGKIAESCLLKIPMLYSDILIDKYVIMPNHIHAIIVIRSDPQKSRKTDLSIVLGQYKMTVTKLIRLREPGKKVWQRSFHDHIIRNQRRYEWIWMYIENNPLKWEEDGFYVSDRET